MTYCMKSNQAGYPFVLPELPFDKAAFAPHFSAETFDYHHGKHHQAYVTNLNNLLVDNKDYAGKSLEEIILLSAKDQPAIFNNAAQIWNHTFFWHSITPGGGGSPSDLVMKKIVEAFGSFESFITQFKQAAVSQFGSGWAWLVVNNGKLEIVKTANAETPITKGLKPVLACDVWEHAYYIDYRNKRPDYVSTFIDHMINWKFVEAHLSHGA